VKNSPQICGSKNNRLMSKILLFTLFFIGISSCAMPESKYPAGEVTHVLPDYARKNDLPELQIDTLVLPKSTKINNFIADDNLSKSNFDKSNIAQNEDLPYLMGKFDPTTDDRFVEIDAKWSNKRMFLRQETNEAFVKMAEAAQKDGIKLTIISATRNFEQQKAIWEAKWTGKTLVEGKNIAKTIADPTKRALKILEFSSMPSTSRHHWGTDMDLNNLSDGYFTKKNSTGAKIYAWLKENAADFGFCQPYSAGRSTGYHEEKWHWTYLPLSRKFTEMAEKQLNDAQISGFLGSETAVEIGAVQNYVLAINADCR
jgi:zinc D-Ala-D-Ala carboxypeptidase